MTAGSEDHGSPAPGSAPHLRVFIASPADVAEEREIARRALQELPYDPLLEGRVTIEIVAWDQPGNGPPMLANMAPQAAIAAGLARPSECDIAIAILWSRMGTPIPGDWDRKPDGSPYQSGTEWEIHDAIRGNTAHGKPEVLIYRRTQIPSFPFDDQIEERIAQGRKVEAFFRGLTGEDGAKARGYNNYSAPDEFGRLLHQHLRHLIRKRLLADAAPGTTWEDVVGGFTSLPGRLKLIRKATWQQEEQVRALAIRWGDAPEFDLHEEVAVELDLEHSKWSGRLTNAGQVGLILLIQDAHEFSAILPSADPHAPPPAVSGGSRLRIPDPARGQSMTIPSPIGAQTLYAILSERVVTENEKLCRALMGSQLKQETLDQLARVLHAGSLGEFEGFKYAFQVK